MNTYESLLDESIKEDLQVFDYTFRSSNIKGLYCDGTIALSKNLKTIVEKTCVLAEELGHYHTSTGDIIDQTSVISRKQERAARLWAYNKMFGLSGLADALLHSCTNIYEIAEYLDVTEDALLDALVIYKSKYGLCATLDNHTLYFEPLGLYEAVE